MKCLIKIVKVKLEFRKIKFIKNITCGEISLFFITKADLDIQYNC